MQSNEIADLYQPVFQEDSVVAEIFELKAIVKVKYFEVLAINTLVKMN